MNDLVAAVMTLYSVLIPTKSWYAPNQPLLVKIDQPQAVLVVRDFYGKRIEPAGDTSITQGKEVDLRAVFPQVGVPGAYIVLAMPKDGQGEFYGTPLVITVRADKRPEAPAGAMVTKVAPLCYAKMTTEHGDVSIRFYYDAAPNTVDSFLGLAYGGYFDGLSFHRIVPGFVVQGGDPRGDGSGGPGYTIDAEFNDRPHDEGVLSMARQGDPNEAAGVMPRAEFANSAGSQFFICLDPARTRQLDRRYTAFAKVFAGMEAVKKVAAAPIADPRNGRPQKPQLIKSVKVIPVTAKDNPYITKDMPSPASTAPSITP
jgi:peptidyl-prolyl cis-trans isomerase B (cyclophilin B)